MFQRTAPTPTTLPDPFAARFGARYQLPRGLRAEAGGMDWPLFTATYCPAPELKITTLDATKLRAGRFRFTAEMTLSSKTERPRTFHHEITASGAVSAITHLLAEHGRYVEIRTFRQVRLFEATVTFAEVAHQLDHTRTAWAVGFGATPELSAANTLASGAQRIHG